MSRTLKKVNSKTKRRGNNEGSIYYLESKKLWCGQVTIGYKPDGGPNRKTCYGKTRQETAKKVATLSAAVFVNGYAKVPVSTERNFQILVQDWFDLFFIHGKASTTRENRQNMLNNHIFKVFGKMDIQDVSLEALQRFFNAKVKSGTAVDSINKMKSLLRNFFIYAVKKGIICSNPMDDVKVNKRDDSNNGDDKSLALREEVREQVFRQVSENPILKPIITTLSLTGLRPQELLSLERRHLNFDRKILSVKQAVKRHVEYDDAGKVIARSELIGSTKTANSVRDILLSDVVVQILKEWLEYCTEHNICSKFVFPNTKTGGMRTYAGLRSLLTRFIKKHGLEDEGISLYTFRHTFATMLLEERENPKVVAALMGHKKVSTTLNIYSHVVNKEVFVKTAQTLDGVFARYASV